MTTATLRWVNPTTRAGADGGKLAPKSIGAVRIFDSASPGGPAVPIAVVPGGDEAWRSDVLSPGTHNFTLVWVDTDGRASDASKMVTVVVEATAPLAPPSPGTDVVVEVRDADGVIVPPAKPAAAPVAKSAAVATATAAGAAAAVAGTKAPA